MRVTLSLRGDYAVRTMVALGRHPGPGPLPAALIAEQMDIPVRFVAHVLRDLSVAGLVVGRQGRGGGYELAVPPGDIDLLRIVDAAEGRREQARCVLRGGPCDVHGHCAVHDAFWAATQAVRAQLAGTTLEDITRRS